MEDGLPGWTDTWLIKHGDRKSHKDRVVGALPNGLNGLYMGVINYLLNGMFLQVVGAVAAFFFVLGLLKNNPDHLDLVTYPLVNDLRIAGWNISPFFQ